MQALRSRIDSVTVYRQGARITRLATLERGADGFPETVQVPGLPLGLLDDSVRARVISAPGHALGAPRATDIRVSLSVERSGEPLPPADNDELERARLAVIEQEALIKQIERELERLSHFDLRARIADAKDGPAPTTPLEARLALLQSRNERWKSLHGELTAAKVELKTRRRHRRTLEQAEKRASSAREPRESELRKCAVISIAGGSAESAQLAIEYRVAGARWAPAYVARLSSDGTAAELGVRAVVAQRTGEDWSGVEMTLVTASADTTTELPELASLRIGRRQPPARTGWRPAPVGADALFGDYDRTFGGQLAPDETLEADEDDWETPTNMAPPMAPPPPAMPPQQSMVTMAGSVSEHAASELQALADMPAAESARAAPMAKRGGLGLFSRSSAAPARAKKQAAPAPGGYGGGVHDEITASFALSELEPDLEPQAVRADDSLLDYSGLRMAGPSASARGHLVRESLRVRYREELVIAKWEASYDLVRVVSAAGQAAISIAHKPLPEGHDGDFTGDFDYSYFASSRLDVPSDGDFHSVALTNASGPCDMLYQVCPRESTDVFRIARLTNPLDAPLIRGPIDVYIGGDFLLSTQVGFTPPGGVLRFGLGVEQAVRVVRNTSFRDDSAGLLGGSRELHHQIRVEAQNHLERPIQLEVRERVPVTREDEDDIRVELGAVSPRWEAFEPGDDEGEHPPLKGGFRWRCALAGGDKTELKASYSIRISSKHELVGGNRRES